MKRGEFLRSAALAPLACLLGGNRSDPPPQVTLSVEEVEGPEGWVSAGECDISVTYSDGRTMVVHDVDISRVEWYGA